EEILSRVPLTSLNAVRSTCKTWNALSKTMVFGKAAAVKKQLFVGFIMMDYRVCSMKFHLQNEGGDLVVPCIKQVGILNQLEISKVLHCDGLLLCVTKDNSSLVVWNPYLGQTRWIQPQNNFHKLDKYALGYDKNRNHKILRVFSVSESGLRVFGYEIYSLSSNSWKVFDATTDWDIHFFEPGVSLKGNTYFLAEKKTREEHLAVLHQGWKFSDTMELIHTLEIWVTNKIDLGSVSWTRFLTSTSGCRVHPLGGSFFIDEEKKVAVVFDVDAQYYEVKT
ncbi:F-box associated domain type 1, partial [Arabidopsis thaliana x Arabidopsis arenosa]